MVVLAAILAASTTINHSTKTRKVFMTIQAPVTNHIPEFLLQQSEPVQQLLETASLYLHVPFCHTRCHYCDFNTYAGILPLREPYVRALLTEIELAGQMTRHADGTLR